MLIGNTTIETDALRADPEKFYITVYKLAGEVVKGDEEVTPELRHLAQECALDIARLEFLRKGKDIFGPATRWWDKFWYNLHNMTRIDVIIGEEGKPYIQVKTTCFR